MEVTLLKAKVFTPRFKRVTTIPHWIVELRLNKGVTYLTQLYITSKKAIQDRSVEGNTIMHYKGIYLLRPTSKLRTLLSYPRLNFICFITPCYDTMYLCCIQTICFNINYSCCHSFITPSIQSSALFSA